MGSVLCSHLWGKDFISEFKLFFQWKKNECPLQNQCLSKGIIYQAMVTSHQDETETYVRLTDTTFKTRLANHKQSFKNESLKNQTELSKHIWDLKKRRKTFSITWRILGKARSYSTPQKDADSVYWRNFLLSGINTWKPWTKDQNLGWGVNKQQNSC